MALLQSLDTKGKITLGAVALGFLVAVALLFKLSSSPSWQTVSSGLDPASTGKVTKALDERGIAYELQNGGTAIAVQEAQAPTARIALAEAGVNAGAQPGFELLDKQKLGSSSFQQQVAYQRALEGQIAQTIAQVQGVSNAQVRLSMPKDELFTDEEKPATAAVLLGSSAELDPGAVKGIANLVASSVPGLKADGVTITDATGQLLWPQENATGGGGSLTAKQAAQARYESQLQTQIDAMLLRTLGAGKAQVQVRADLDADDTTREELQYADEGVPLSEVQETETLRGRGAAGATAGTGSNIPAYAQAATGGGSSNYRKSSTKRELGVDKTVTRTKVAPGTVKRLSVSVLVDRAARPDLPAIQKAVEAAAGVQTGRDTVSVQAVQFAKAPEVEKPGGPLAAVPAGVGSAAKIGAVGLGVLLFLFFVARHLRRRETEELGTPSWLAELEGATRHGLPAPAGEPAAGGAEAPVNIPAMADFVDPRKSAIEDLVAREPERVAAQLRTWITNET
ncbi:MAG TPA: flagellar basal-body MS-ring/collar protein FliF [Baekduia sp.]|nr:flagellar basal-body MS-ring/collar protein FliF [Baekduia sp.]